MKIHEATAFGLQVAALPIAVMGGWAALSVGMFEKGYGEMAATLVVMLAAIAHHLYGHDSARMGFWRRGPERNCHRQDPPSP